jgi:hypothetical protein
MDSRTFRHAGVVSALIFLVSAPIVVADGGHGRDGPRLAGRAVLPVETYAPGPPSGSGLVPAGQTDTVINGIHFPTPSQPVEGSRRSSPAGSAANCWRCLTTASGARPTHATS